MKMADQGGCSCLTPTSRRGYNPLMAPAPTNHLTSGVCSEGQAGKGSLALSQCQLSSALTSHCLLVLLFVYLDVLICSFAHLDLTLPSVLCPWTWLWPCIWLTLTTAAAPHHRPLLVCYLTPGTVSQFPSSDPLPSWPYVAIPQPICVVCNTWYGANIN